MRNRCFSIISLILLGLIFSFSLPSHADDFVGHYDVRQLSVSDGLPGNTIRDIRQDSNGLLWMAGTGGLACYDGYRFVSFNQFGGSSTLAIPRHIGKLYITPSHDQLWLSTATYNQFCFDLQRGRFIDYTGRGDEDRPYRKLMPSSNGIWLISNTYGLRRVTKVNGKYTSTDFTANNHRLPGNQVMNIAEDCKGNIWVSSDKGLVRIDKSDRTLTRLKGKKIMGCFAFGDKIIAYVKSMQTAFIFNVEGRMLRKVPLSPALGHVNAIRGTINWQGKWIVFTGVGTFALDMHTYQFSKPADYQIPNGTLYDTIGDLQFVGNRTGNLWIFPKRGAVQVLHLFDMVNLSRENNRVFSVTQGKDGLYYIGSYGGGLFVYNRATGKISQYTANDRNPLILTNYIVYATTDRSGCIWLSTENGGVTCLVPSESIAEYQFINNTILGDWTNYIQRLNPLPNGFLDIETKARELYTYNILTGAFSPKGTVGQPVTESLVDHQGRLWQTTLGQGVLINGKQAEVTANGKHVETIDYTALAKDRYGRIWLGSKGAGLMLVKTVTGNTIRTEPAITSQYNESRINDIAVTADKIYVATYNGLYAADLKKQGVRPSDFMLYHTSAKNFPADEVVCLYPTAHNIVWVGTVGGGLVRCDFSHGVKNMTYKMLTTKDGLSNNNIRSIVADKRGNLWAGTDAGISRITPDGRYIRRYLLTNNALSNTFTKKCAVQLNNGHLAFGTANGMVLIDPTKDKIDKAPVRTVPFITDLYVNGISVLEGLDSVITDKALPLTEKVRLDHNQNSLTFFFSSCDYHNITSQAYQYYLEGVDHSWRPVTVENRAEYSNLSPGTYTFHLRLVNAAGPGQERTLIVHISEPWYNTIWAWLCYLLIIATVGLFLYRNTKERLRMHQQVKLEKQVADFRTEFFTHITHEFRTPLAIAQTAIERVSQPGNPYRKDAQTAQRGIRRLLRLVNQFLEYRRIETGKLRLQVEKNDIITFAQDVFLDFRIIAEQKHINMNFTPFNKKAELLFDHRLVESILYNLLSNAVKYAPEKSTVSFYIKNNGKMIDFIVEDNGPGIGNEQLKNLFHPFMEGNVSKGGMGIGLYTSYQMALLHHGMLSYSNVSPHGARFTLSIPKEWDYQPEEYSTKRQTSVTNDDKHYEEIIREMAPEAINSQRVAVIEDDVDMQEQLKTEVGAFFQTTVYGNGKDAIEGITANPPSLILCDIMLPDTNGYEIVKKLHEEGKFKDIPVIMLTALDDEDHQIKGYKVGADDYMVKPCNYHLLIARMIQLITWHEKRKAEQPAMDVPQENAAEKDTASNTVVLTSRADKRFRQQVEAVVSQHLGDSTLSVDRLAEMLSMGRTKFYGKVKEVFGMSPNKYLLARRMEAAAELLDEGKYNVSEVSYRVGFSDPIYFNRCFKAHFGMVPSKYKKR
jgi:signal transduction histidine kinase/DNA-binding response OmpR family regulator/ligand-binding sensor domain-containing protein